MDNPHQNARLTVYGREQIVARVAAGQSAAEVAQAFGVSVRTVRKWLARFREGGPAALQNRSSAPRTVSARLPQRVLVLIAWLRGRLRLTGATIARKLDLPRSTVARGLTRRLAALDPPDPVRRYQRDHLL